MTGWQVEDNLWAECYRAAAGLPVRTDFWKKHQNPRAAEHRGGSGNFWWMACGVASKLGKPDPIRNVTAGTDQPHDFDLVEPYVDDEHARFILAGKTLARDGFLFGANRHDALAHRLSAELRQFWSSLLLCSTTPERLATNFIVRAGARASGTKTQRYRLEYLVLRCAGWSEKQILKGAVDGKKIVRGANRVDKNQEFSTAQMFDALGSSFAADFDAVYRPFKERGFEALAQFFVIGTRVPFEWVRYADGSFDTVMEANCNANNGPRWSSSWRRGEKVPVQWPKRAVKRMQFEHGSAGIDLGRRVVWADGESSGRWERPMPLSPIILHLRSDKLGCRALRYVEGRLPPQTDPGPEAPLEREPRWWEFWK